MGNASNIFNISKLFWSGTNGGISTSAGAPVISAPTGLNNITFNSGISYHRTQVLVTSGAALYTGLATDFIIGCLFHTGTSGVIVLPSALNNSFVIKDESGTAGISNIIISGLSNIEGSPNYLLSSSGAAINVYNTPNGWRIF